MLPRLLWERLSGGPSNTPSEPVSAAPFPRTPTPAVAPEDPVPALTDGETNVWLTEWQVEDDGFDVAVGEHVAWTLYESDHLWIDQILAVPRTVPLQRDTYDHERSEDELSTRRDLRGVVIRIDQVSVRFVSSERRGYSAPEAHGGQLHTVSSLSNRRPHHGAITGWIVRVRS
ncbi:hypothetical protein DEJ33_14070 [Curtobacterium sp. MCPF17_047]|uniref:DUF6578 domain-containing protein n=1 Tax=Curtobacterium sp. MCPF17_047 TaxID=2175654 RepID=UPI000DA8688C|nr:DUF6578 domain-containing protein [Curtobacterium sp. MCPF17_047]PZF63498.1 hypothetical protein DEJ33_14070 [Curtobacterium sp. MCPF17_047]